jgi:uncharacterized membrane protein YphA (DoxX/SURF4 family)
MATQLTLGRQEQDCTQDTKAWSLWWYPAVLLRLGLGALFLWSSLSKLVQPVEFLDAVYNYELVGPRLGFAIALALPWLELVLGIALLAGLWERGALALTVFLFCVFLLVRSLAFSQGLRIPCGCSTQTNQIISSRDVVESALLLLGAVTALSCSLIASWRRPAAI